MITINRERQRLMTAIDHGHIRRSTSGAVVWHAMHAPANRRCDRKVQQLVDASIAHLGDDGGTYQLTDAGRAALAAATAARHTSTPERTPHA